MTNPIEEYIEARPEPIRTILRELMQIILEVDPSLTQTISYQMPTFKKNGKAVFHFAAQANHLGIYPTPQPIEVFRERLKGYKTSKGTIQWPNDRPLDKQLIQDMLRLNLAQLGSSQEDKK